MTENPMNKSSDKPTTDRPAPNGHGASNSVRPPDATAEGSAKDIPSSAKNKNKNKSKKQRHQHNQTQADSSATATTASPGEPTEPTALNDPQPSIDQSAAPMIEETAAPMIEESVAPSIEQPIRLRMKVWTDPTTAKRYLVPSAFMRDLVNGQPINDIMYAYALRDNDVQVVTLTAGEWQALPFVHVQEDGPAPRAERDA